MKIHSRYIKRNSITVVGTGINPIPPPLLVALNVNDLTIPSCNSQDDVNSVFDIWIAGFGYTGGCNVTESGLNVSSTNRCGGSVTVNYIVTDNCGQSDSETSTFTVDQAPELSIICPDDVLLPSCTSQEFIDAAYGAWLEGFTYNGGCNVTASGFNTPPPSYCGGSVTRNYSVYDDCDKIASCSSTFTIESSPIVNSWCAGDMNIPSCNTQTDINLVFDAWLSGFGYTGGCDIVENGLNVSAPLACGGSTVVNYSVTDSCSGESPVCTSIFTVDPAPELTIICPNNADIPINSSQAEVDAAFSLWISSFTYNGGCNVIEIGLDGHTPPLYDQISTTTVNYSVSDDCGQSAACSSNFNIVP